MTPESPVADSVNSNRVNNRELYAVVHSRTFSRSDQLQAFLRYICDLELAGRGNEISEYSIATEALHRPAAYAPGEDSSVRSRAHALRRKLDEYYETEAPQSELRIELPKGSYRPIFVAKRQQPVPIRTTATPTLKQRRWLAPGILIAAILITAALTSLLVRRDAIDPLVREAWGPILHPGGDVLLLISAPPMFRPVQSQPDRKPLPQSTTLEPAPAWASQWFDNQHLDSRGGPLYLAPSRGYSVFSDSIASMAVTSLIGAVGGSYHALPEPAIQPMAIHENGLVILGAAAYTPYVTRVLKATPYSFWFDAELNQEVLGIKADPKAPRYLAKRNPQTTRYSTVYGLITVLPSQPGHPRPERTLLFTGFTGSPGPQAAIDFFRSPAALRDLLDRFRRQGFTRFPPAYQVVVRCGVDAENAINAIYETHQVMTAPPVIE